MLKEIGKAIKILAERSSGENHQRNAGEVMQLTQSVLNLAKARETIIAADLNREAVERRNNS